MNATTRIIVRRFLITSTIAVGLLCVVVQTPERSTAAALAADPHTLVVARDLSDAKTLDPDRMYEISDEATMSNVYDTLVTFHGSNITHVQPSLATRWTVSPNSRVFTFSLRQNVRFSNGDPLTAADVVFSYRRLGYLDDNPAFLMGATKVGDNIVIDQVRALGKYTVQFTLPAPDVSFLAALTTAPTFGVLDVKVVRAHGGDDSPTAATTDQATAWLNDHSIGTGPFDLTRWVRGGTGEIVLKRNPYYRGPRPVLNQIIVQGTPDANSQRLEVERGSVDIAANIDLDAAKSMRRDPNVTLVTGSTLDLIYLAMITKPELSRPLSKIKVRQAIRTALDYHGIIQGLLGGIGTQPNGMIPVGMLGNDRATNNRLKPRTDLSLARRLMTQAGYPHGFSVKLAYPAGSILDGVSYDLLAPKVAHDLSAIRIHVTLQPMQFSVIIPAFRSGTEAFTLLPWLPDYPDPNDYGAVFASGRLAAQHVGYTWDTNLTKLVTRADTTSDLKQRAALYRQIQQIWLIEGPWAPLVQPKGIVVLHHGITNYQFSPVFTNNLSFVRKG